jgi:hypothetical protein
MPAYQQFYSDLANGRRIIMPTGVAHRLSAQISGQVGSEDRSADLAAVARSAGQPCGLGAPGLQGRGP